MKLPFQVGPILFEAEWARSDSPFFSREMGKYAPVPEAERHRVPLRLAPPLERLAAPRSGLSELPGNWRCWEEAGAITLQVWNGILGDWSIESRISADFSALEISVREAHPNHDHLELQLATVLRWFCAQRIVKEGGLLLHGAAILHHASRKSFIGTGPSGAGKSTLSNFFRADPAFEVLTDETLIVAPDRGTWTAWGTPWAGMLSVARNACGPLSQLLFLEKTQAHLREEISREAATLRLVKEIFLPPWRGALTDRALDNALALIREVPCYRLGFRKEASITHFLSERIR